MLLQHRKCLLFPKKPGYQNRVRRGVSRPALVALQNETCICLLGYHYAPPIWDYVSCLVRMPSSNDKCHLIEHTAIDIGLHWKTTKRIAIALKFEAG
jgi:hypothetical protein